MNEKTQLFNLPRIDLFIPDKSEETLEKQDFTKSRNYVIQGMSFTICFALLHEIMASITEKNNPKISLLRITA
jgi:hypothetical protein